MEVKNILNGHSYLASLYRHTYLKQTPHGLCDYVWGVLFAILALPFTWTVIVYNTIVKNIELKSDNTYDISYSASKPINGFLNTIWFLFSGILLSVGFGVDDNYTIWSKLSIAYLLGLAGVAVLIGSVLLLMYSVEAYQEKFPRKTKYKPYKPSSPSIFKLIWQGFVAFKEKNCPVVTWDYTKKPK